MTMPTPVTDMELGDLRVTYVGGSTALFEIERLRLLTDPTFDPAGTEYKLGSYTLHKVRGSAVDLASMRDIDAVLLNHAHHLDNLDHAGRLLLSAARQVLTTALAAEQLGGSPRAWGFGKVSISRSTGAGRCASRARRRDMVHVTPIADR